MRVQLEDYLHQEKIDRNTGKFVWQGRLNQDGSGRSQGMKQTERYLLINFALTQGRAWVAQR